MERSVKLPTHISINRGLVAHYQDGSAVGLAQMEPTERNAVLTEIMRRYNDHMALIEQAQGAAYASA